MRTFLGPVSKLTDVATKALLVAVSARLVGAVWANGILEYAAVLALAAALDLFIDFAVAPRSALDKQSTRRFLFALLLSFAIGGAWTPLLPAVRAASLLLALHLLTARTHG